MNLQKTTDWIIRHEGLRTWAYKDTRGIWTTAIGFNLERQGADAVLRAHGIDADAVRDALQHNFRDSHGVVRSRDDVVSAEQAKQLAAADIQDSVADLRSLVQGFDAMPDDAQMVLVDLHFNLGSGGLRKWPHTLADAVRHDWQAMADDLVNNHVWVSQVGPRAAEDAAVLRAIIP